MITANIKQRKQIRLKNYDYSTPGAYFVTICTQNRACVFGNIIVGAGPCAGPITGPCAGHLNDIGLMVESVWRDMPNYYHGVKIDDFVIMPNHIHGIVILTSGIGRPSVNGLPRGDAQNGQPQGAAPTTTNSKLTLPDIIHRFKSLTTARYRHGVKQNGWPSFPGRLWQRNYYERIIRNEYELHRIKQYVQNNAQNWGIDKNNSLFGEES